MGQKRRSDYWNDDDSLSEELEDVLEYPTLAPHDPIVDTRSWVDKHAPQRTHEVCINPRKLKEIRSALQDMVVGALKCRLLVLAGSSGSSKSTVIKCLASELLASKVPSLHSLLEYSHSFVDDIPLPMHFADFLDSCRYRVGPNLSVVLMEELPNIFHEETLFQFRMAIRDWIFTDSSVALPPLVLCLTELDSISDETLVRLYNIENTLTVDTLLGRSLLASAGHQNLIKRIKVPPLAKTFISKVITKIYAAEGLTRAQTRHREFLAPLFETGDIRCLINNLEFWAKSATKTLGAFSFKENQLTLFHAVGKILYATSDVSSKKCGVSLDYHSISSVVDAYQNLDLLHFGLLENYHICSGLDWDIRIAASITEGLSVCDALALAPESREYGLLSTRIELRKIPHSSSRALTMRFPRHFQLLKERNKVSEDVYSYRRYLQMLRVLAQDVNLIDGCLVPQILNSYRYKMAHDITKSWYGRIGGSFKKLFAESSLVVMEHEDEKEARQDEQFSKDIREAAGKADAELGVGKEDELSEEIEDSLEDDNLEDTLDDQLLAMTQGGQPRTRSPVTAYDDADDEMQDEPELNLLVSRGMI